MQSYSYDRYDIRIDANNSNPEALLHDNYLYDFIVVFTLSRSFCEYPTTPAVAPVSFLILHPREIQIMWSQTVRQRVTMADYYYYFLI